MSLAHVPHHACSMSSADRAASTSVPQHAGRFRHPLDALPVGDGQLRAFAAAWSAEEIQAVRAFLMRGFTTFSIPKADLIIRYLPFGQPNEHAPRQYTGVYGRRLAPGESLLVPRTGRPYPGFGPGGRAVHKANSNVEVRLPLDKVAWLPKYVAHNIRRMEPLRVNGSFELVVFSNHGYFQATNFHKCLEEIVRIVKAAAILPDWEGDATRSTIGLHAQVDNERRLRGKKRRSEIKAARRLIADR
ncbi:hypothetical protein H696_04487 [Fonticula alba]|uniref:Uncharacterized protein n=1 Tax=Fonticula alba TaxID=691883 RepID=A0A058Z494_FONAL|nr:hypothetical protein H696_04487 [Fonticula alba]KCV69070.1 hypothetical protein H696_04487 [Fonticula alba]|eukprot:XP_009496641.1 hypothetical protein H696_04487 [Fonticula alba]